MIFKNKPMPWELAFAAFEKMGIPADISKKLADLKVRRDQGYYRLKGD